MQRFIDAHCHYDAAAFKGYSGAGRFICNAVCEGDWKVLTDASRNDTKIIPAIGVHPWHADAPASGWDLRLDDILCQNPDVMVGEIGLDRARGDFERQYIVFKIQMAIAARRHRAVHLHCVRAWDFVLDVLKHACQPPVIVAHRFSGSVETMRDLMRITGDRVFFSYKDAATPRMRRIVSMTPPEHVLVETDGFAPMPEQIFQTVANIADIMGTPPDIMADKIYENTMRVIKNGQTA